MLSPHDGESPTGIICQSTTKTKDTFVCTESLKCLRAITNGLPAFPKTTGPQLEGFKQHKMSRGTSLSWNLLAQEEISCARWFNSAGTEFPLHSHEQREWLIVYWGSMVLKIDGQAEQRLLPGMCSILEPGVAHSASFLEDCWCLAITVPYTSDWPE